MNSSDTSPSYRISSRASIHSSRECNCKSCLDPATIRNMNNTSQDHTSTELPAEGIISIDVVDRHDSGDEGLQSPNLNPVSKEETVNAETKSDGERKINLFVSQPENNVNDTGSGQIISCPSTPDAAGRKKEEEIVRGRHEVNTNSDNDLVVPDRTEEHTTPEQSDVLQNSKTYFGVVVALLAFCGVFLKAGDTSDIYNAQSFSNDLNRLKTDYKLTKDALLSFEAGLQFIKQEKSTSCIIMSYGDKYRVPLEDRSFIDSMSSVAAKYLGNSTKANPIILDQGELSVEDREYLQTNYRHELENRRVMAVKHLEALPAETALAFHFFCDEYYPLVKNTAIILLLDTRKCDIGNADDIPANAVEQVERCLMHQWSEIDNDELRPLLNRVINVVIDLEKV